MSWTFRARFTNKPFCEILLTVLQEFGWCEAFNLWNTELLNCWIQCHAKTQLPLNQLFQFCLLKFDFLSSMTIHSHWFWFYKHSCEVFNMNKPFLINSISISNATQPFKGTFVWNWQDVTWLPCVPPSQTWESSTGFFIILILLNEKVIGFRLWKCTEHWSPQGFFLR